MHTKGLTNKQIVSHRKQIVNAYKISKGCEICGYNKDPHALCFDHIDPSQKHEMVKNGASKRSSSGGMFMLYGKKYSDEILISEIKKCRILCSNCHMEHTYDKMNNGYEYPKISSIEELEKCLKRD